MGSRAKTNHTASQLLPIGCWDGDFVFESDSIDCSVLALVEERSQVNEAEVSEASEIHEDWDLELSLGGNIPEVLVFEPEHEEPSVANSTALVTTYKQMESLAPMESLLEYIDGHLDSVLFREAHRTRALPRQPTLFSVYAACQHQRNKVDKEKHNCMMTQRPKSMSSPLKNRLLIIKQTRDVPSAMNTASYRPEITVALVPSPHAPESTQGTVAWLQNLCYKVSHTSAVVARPSPEQFNNNHQRERPPSEEVALERELRAAEMAYCVGKWCDCGARTKALLHRLDAASCSAAMTTGASHGDGPLRPPCLDDDLRCHQCCGRLARLVCRLAQRHDELCVIKILRATSIKERLGISGIRGGSTMPPPLDAGDIAAFRRGTTALVYSINDAVLQAKSKLTLNEALAHLALVKY